MRLPFIFFCILALSESCKLSPKTGDGLLPGALEEYSLRISASIGSYNYSQFNTLERSYQKDITGSSLLLKDPLSDCKWKVITEVTEAEDTIGSWDFNIKMILKKGTAKSVSAAIVLKFENWSSGNYVLLPGAAYNGNRYPSRSIAYSPKLLDPRDIGPEKGIIISDIPRLNIENGPSTIQIRSGNCSLPGFGYFSTDSATGFFIATKQGNSFGDFGLSLSENRNKTKAVFRINSPVVREKYKYKIANSRIPSDDIPADIYTGDTIDFSFRLYFFNPSSISDYFRQFSNIRANNTDTVRRKLTFSLSSCFSAIEDKFNRMNYVPKYGYYSVGMRENFLQDWQIGWTGGMISTWPLLMDGKEESNKRVINNFNWLFPNGISPSGFFWDSGENGILWYGGDIRKPHTANWHLIRKSGDGLFYVLQQLEAMSLMEIPIQKKWENGTRGVADAFCRLWQKNGQLGQFVDSHSGEIIVGGSTSGAIVPAALVKSSQYFGEPLYLNVAQEIADSLYKNYIGKGITCGGPGDAMQCPDSESAYAMLESFMSLFEATGDQKWLGRSEDMACQFSSWVMNYDYNFPDSTLAGRLGIQTKGSVFANAQNNHGAPGICTYSGNALLRLYRATGKDKYLTLLKDIAQFLPQNLSHPQRPIPGMETGWLSERVNTNDWLEGIGKTMYGSTWSETALMLTFTEVPGIYIRSDLGKIWAFDQVDAWISNIKSDSLEITIINPTQEEAIVKILSESVATIDKVLNVKSIVKYNKVRLYGRETKKLTFKK